MTFYDSAITGALTRASPLLQYPHNRPVRTMAPTRAAFKIDDATAKNLLERPEVLETLEKIAEEEMFIPTLKLRGMDSLDFHDVGTGGAARALAKAYLKGMEVGAIDPEVSKAKEEKAPAPTAAFTHDEIGFIQLASNKVLAAVVRGELDLNVLAAKTLKARGYDENEKWVGFRK